MQERDSPSDPTPLTSWDTGPFNVELNASIQKDSFLN